MTPYKSKSGKQSGVTAYEIGEDYIDVQFEMLYRYSNKSCGSAVVLKMKQLAKASNGLSSYIARNNPNYEWRK